MELNLFHFSVDAFHVSGFNGQDTGVLKLDAMAQTSCCAQTQFILEGVKETGDLPRQEAYSFNVMSCWHPADVLEGWSTKGQEGHQCQILSRCVLPVR
jgi:hypothetical protein